MDVGCQMLMQKTVVVVARRKLRNYFSSAQKTLRRIEFDLSFLLGIFSISLNKIFQGNGLHSSSDC
jgi:hypothetical protein